MTRPRRRSGSKQHPEPQGDGAQPEQQGQQRPDGAQLQQQPEQQGQRRQQGRGKPRLRREQQGRPHQEGGKPHQQTDRQGRQSRPEREPRGTGERQVRPRQGEGQPYDPGGQQGRLNQEGSPPRPQSDQQTRQPGDQQLRTQGDQQSRQQRPRPKQRNRRDQRGQGGQQGRPGQPDQESRQVQGEGERPDSHQSRPRQQRRIDQRGPSEQRVRSGQRGSLEQRGRPGQRFRPSQRPRSATDGIVAKSQRGEFGESWWAKRWIDVLESFGFGNRLNRGRTYARSGAVLSIDVSQGRVVARVQGSRPTPYKVAISVIPLSNAQWERAIDAMADQAIFTAKLLAGEMPREIEQAFATARVSLFPQSVHDIQTECSCPDYANPCKHVAAVYYLLGERFDEDPFLAFELRGRSKEKIIAGLRVRRADTTPDAPLPETPVRDIPALTDLLASFDEPGPELEQIAPHVAAPNVASTMLRRYGPSPGDTTNDLHAAYLLMTRATLERLFASE